MRITQPPRVEGSYIQRTGSVRSGLTVKRKAWGVSGTVRMCEHPAHPQLKTGYVKQPPRQLHSGAQLLTCGTTAVSHLYVSSLTFGFAFFIASAHQSRRLNSMVIKRLGTLIRLVGACNSRVA